MDNVKNEIKISERYLILDINCFNSNKYCEYIYIYTVLDKITDTKIKIH